MEDLGLHANYWKGLKDYYEKDYNGIMPGLNATTYAKEIERKGATFLDTDRPFDPDDVITWAEEMEENANDDADDDTEYDNETAISYPGVYSYADYYEEIAAYFLHRDLDRFRDEIINNNPDFIKEAIRLNWIDMLESNPTLSEVFLF